MYEITNPTTGAYQEVANSPFASSVTNQPAYVAVEPTGQFIAVVNRVGQNPGDGLVETFQISPSAPGGPALIPVAGSGTELDSTAIGFAQPPNNKTFLIFMGANPQSSNMAITQGSEFQALSIDPSTGLITGYQQDAALSQRGLSFAMDPQGRYYVTGTQDNLLEFGIIQLVGIGGDALLGNIQLPEHNYPDGLWVDSTGTFVYAAINDLSGPDVVNIYSVNLQTGVLTETASSPLPSLTSVPPILRRPYRLLQLWIWRRPKYRHRLYGRSADRLFHRDSQFTFHYPADQWLSLLQHPAWTTRCERPIDFAFSCQPVFRSDSDRHLRVRRKPSLLQVTAAKLSASIPFPWLAQTPANFRNPIPAKRRPRLPPPSSARSASRSLLQPQGRNRPCSRSPTMRPVVRKLLRSQARAPPRHRPPRS